MRRDELSQADTPVFLIPVGEIEVPADRLRSLKIDQATAIGQAIAADRQYDPISVTQLPGQQRYLLVDGLHRLEGCRAVGLKTIEARVVPNDRAGRTRQEVLSAWARAAHDAFDRAAQIDAMTRLAGEPLAYDEGASAMIALAGWSEAAAEALGISRRTVFNYLKLHRFYSAAQVLTLRERGLAGELVPLMRLAALPPEEFAQAWMAIEASEVASIAEALALVAPAPVQPFDKKRAKVVNQAAGWPAHEVRQLIADLRRLYAEKTSTEARG
jgi:hypothetical protein